MPMRNTIAVFTGSRAEYGLLFPTLQRLSADSSLEVNLIVTGAHLSRTHGATADEIARDGFEPALQIPLAAQDDSDVEIAHAIATIIHHVAQYFARTKPAALLLLGDRYEVLAAATAALVSRVPIVHLHGGEATEGLVDEAIRHAVSKMAHLHLVSAEPYRNRLIQMGEQPDRVVVMGATCIDNIRAFSPLPKAEFCARVGLHTHAPFFLVTHHPITLSVGGAAEEIAQLLLALDAFPETQLLFTGVNADMESGTIREAIQGYSVHNPTRVKIVESLGRELYYNALQYCEAVIGNSSSGLLEAPFFGVPTVNIGPRQQGRLRGPSVLDCTADSSSILGAIGQAIDPMFRAQAQQKISPYGTLTYTPAATIHQEIKNFLADGAPLTKIFYTV